MMKAHIYFKSGTVGVFEVPEPEEANIPGQYYQYLLRASGSVKAQRYRYVLSHNGGKEHYAELVLDFDAIAAIAMTE
jgi:hypothetical protein